MLGNVFRKNSELKFKPAACLVGAITLAAALVAGAKTAQATELGHYKATVQSSNAMGGNWNDLGLALMGWTCYGSETVKFSEVLADHKGRLKSTPRNVDSNFKYSLFAMNQPTISRFDRDMNVPDASLKMSLWERCSKTETYTTTEYDSKGKPYLATHTRTKEAWMEWACDTSNLPVKAGDVVHSTCSPGNSYFGDFSIEGILVSMFRQKTFNLDLELQSVEEKYARDFCGSDRSNRVVIGLKQGVGGHVGENDFVFHVTIDGSTKFDLEQNNGILNEEIAYCGASTDVKVEVSATEVDLFFDDQYVPQNTASFSRTSAQTFQKQTIELKRKTYFGELFTDKTSGVAVTMREAP